MSALQGTIRTGSLVIHLYMRSTEKACRASAAIEHVNNGAALTSQLELETFDAPTFKEAWAALSTWLGERAEAADRAEVRHG